MDDFIIGILATLLSTAIIGLWGIMVIDPYRSHVSIRKPIMRFIRNFCSRTCFDSKVQNCWDNSEKSTCFGKCFFQRCVPQAERDVFPLEVMLTSCVMCTFGACKGTHHITANGVSNITMRSITSLWRSQNITHCMSCIFVL